MTNLANDTIWKQRAEEIPNEFDDIHLPNGKASQSADQDAEWCEIEIDGDKHRLRFHDYDRIFKIPGLYEELFYKKLKCCSPSAVVSLLQDLATDFGDEPEEFRVLDVGAGNGMVGDELNALGVDSVIGVDLLPEARQATQRDRPDVYDYYLVTDLTDMSPQHEEKLRQVKPNCLTTVAALGFGDIPPAAFLKALSFITTPGWLAFNIKEDFLRESDSSGFSRLIRQLAKEEYVQLQSYRRYRHRLSMAGEPLYYVAMIAQKLRPITEDLIADWSNTA